MTSVDAVCEAIDRDLMRVKRGSVSPRLGLEAAMATAVQDTELSDPRLDRRQAECAFGLAAQVRVDGDEDRADRLEALAIGLLVQSAKGGDATALQCLRFAGGVLCSLADQALEQNGETILSAASPAGRA